MSGRGLGRWLFPAVALGSALIALGGALVALVSPTAGWPLVVIGALAVFVGPMVVAAVGSGALRRQDDKVRGRTFVTDLFGMREPGRKGGRRDES